MFPPDLPPVSNRALYAYRVFVKWLSFLIFGLSSIILVVTVLPFMRLIFHPRKRFQKHGRRFISCAFKLFIFMMHGLGGLNLEVDNRKNYRKLLSKIVVANHPSILDVVMLISLIPNADCIVNAKLNHGILRGIVSQLFILNSLNLEDLIRTCEESLMYGNCIIIFPEGTRTPRKGRVILKKGAARIAMVSGCSIIPLHIGGTDKYGLGKKDPWIGFNPRERYIYDISMGDEINPEKYRSLPTPAAVRAINMEISSFLFPEKRTI